MTLNETTCVVIPHGGNIDSLDRQLKAISKQSMQLDRVIISCNRPGSYTLLQNYLTTNLHKALNLHIIDSSGTPGPSAARNAGWKSSTEDIILFCDDDDVVSQTWASELYDALAQSDISAGALEYSRLNSELQALTAETARFSAPVKFEHLPYGPTANLGVRREVLQKLNGFNEEAACAEDIDFCWRGQYEGYVFSFAPKAIIHYQLRSGKIQAFKRGFQYGIFDGWLLSHHRQFGAKRSLSSSVRQLLAVPYALVKSLLNKGDFTAFFHKAGAALGRLYSTLKYRIWVL